MLTDGSICVSFIVLLSMFSAAVSYDNVALRRPAFQRDTYIVMEARYAVDGDLNTLSCTSMCCVQSWWAVELSEPTRVRGVKVFNDKSQYWQYRLDNFTVGLANSPPTVGKPLDANGFTRCGNHDGRVLLGGTGFGYVQCSPNVNQQPYKYVIVASSIPTPDAVCMSEAEVCADKRTNWARGRRTIQRDTYGIGSAPRAVDGDYNTASMTTMCCPNAWWAVELDRPTVVYSVRVTNDNNNYFAYRLNDFYIGLSNAAPVPGQSLALNSYTRCAQYKGSVPNWSSVEVKCAANLPAFKFVILQTSWTTNDAICLTEVEVFTEPYDPCQCQPCNNGGVCKPTGDTTFVCQCARGWTSEDCSREVDPCSPSPCKNGGSCKSNKRDFTCTCPPAWTGNDCSVPADPCASSPCKNGGTCTKVSSNEFSCTCVAGWTGKDCTTEVNVCAKSNPCKNGGTCIKYGNSYECRCSPSWAGHDCELGSAACKAIPANQRVNCGWGGISPDQCNARSCCFDTTYKDRPVCFYSKFECDNVKSSERVNCGWEGISYVQCINRGCCFDDDEETNPGPVCFRSANPACVGVKAANRVARGTPAIQPNECNAQGWCFDSSISQSAGPWCFTRA